MSNVAASLGRALLVDALGENLLVRSAPSPRQGGFHRGGAAGVSAAGVVAVAFAGVVFDYDYTVCVAVDVVVLFVAVAVGSPGVLAVAHVDE